MPCNWIWGIRRRQSVGTWTAVLLASLLICAAGFAQTAETKVALKLQDAHLRDAVEMVFKLKGQQFGYDLSEVEKAIKESTMSTDTTGGAPGMMPGGVGPTGNSTQAPPDHLVNEIITIDVPPPGIEWEKIVFMIAKEANLKEPRREGKVYKFFPKPPVSTGADGGMMPGMPGALGMIAPGQAPSPPGAKPPTVRPRKKR
ncbi:MAG: hypothetical protein CO095_02450 [Armatimonadetes bacterium CG_4_9_14_3_um_filter_58_7]|nr:MAG: hypothetical protein CO095_02450 [Armatimonadetes bacterium CG_4_9_14_3_um_filter_58_7]